MVWGGIRHERESCLPRTGLTQQGPGEPSAPRQPQYLQPSNVAEVAGTVARMPLSPSEGSWVCWHFGLAHKCSRSSSSPSRMMDRAVAPLLSSFWDGDSVVGVWCPSSGLSPTVPVPQPRPPAATCGPQHRDPTGTNGPRTASAPAVPRVPLGTRPGLAGGPGEGARPKGEEKK